MQIEKKLICYMLFALPVFFFIKCTLCAGGKIPGLQRLLPFRKKVKSDREIVFFFSFASRENYDLIYEQQLVELLKSRYKYSGFELIPVDFYSPYDNYLADAWCLEESLNANVPRDYRRELYFKNISFLMNEYQSTGLDTDKTHRLESVIDKSFLAIRIPYHSPYTLFKDVIAGCNMHRKKMIEKFNVASVPSIYVNGKYMINYDAMNALGRSRWDYIDLINYLMDKDHQVNR